MSAPRAYRPRRHLRHELYSLAAVLAAPLALVLAFPRQAVGWRARAVETHPRASCALVRLTAAQTDAVLAAARAVLRTPAEGVGDLRADLSVWDLPEASAPEVSDIAARARPVAPPGAAARDGSLARLVWRDAPLPPTRAAPPPEALPRTEGTTPSPPFTRADLLDPSAL